MSILDQKRLIESIHPFELLSDHELDSLMQKVDIAYYPKETLLFSSSVASIAFYIVIKGRVVEMVDDEVHNLYEVGDSFDADALIYSKCEGRFIVDEDLICYEIKKEDFLDLMQNKKVQSYFLQDALSRHQHLKAHDAQNDLTPFLISRVSDIFLHEACIVEPQTSIYDALLKMKELQSTVILMQQQEEYFIATDTDLRDKVLIGGIDIQSPISSIATNKIISIEQNDFLFNALLLMTHHAIKRVVVMDKNRVTGVLEQLDLLSYFANHSHLVGVKIDKAASIDDLCHIQEDIKNLLITLNSKGVKIRYINKLVSVLNAKIYKKLFSLAVPSELQDKCALIVMGSEGRGEQALKTDQDNALIVQEGEDVAAFEAAMMKLNYSLLELGFPKCKGNVMVSNSFWRRDEQGYRELIDSWIESLDEAKLQELSIFIDAKVVAGDEKLLVNLRSYLFRRFEARDDILAHIAKAVLSFETPLSMFSSFVLEKEHNNKLDIKKGGIFAMVHGVRCLALKHKIEPTNTFLRIKELNNKGVIDKEFAKELIEALDTLLSIRLKAMLGTTDFEESNYINPQNLSKIQRDLLKESFKSINKFKKFMSYHFHLNMVS
ncbi:MAG: cyclic nucleotide-binding/CBS domain-containing protein [Campylobacterales bacterium]|nr:cyclic nucleotide-binding/CBS domain-containing protein [Campylobacterales bacterium]